jgi:hypothetical protein
MAAVAAAVAGVLFPPFQPPVDDSDVSPSRLAPIG